MKRRLLVVPTQDHADEALAGDLPPAAATTVAAVETAVAELALAGKRRLSPIGRRLALREILTTAQELPAFQAVAHSAGFAVLVESFLLETAAGGVDARALNDAALWSAPTLRRRLLALAWIAQAYEQRLAKQNLVDPPFSLAAACRRLETGTQLPSLLAGYDEIVFDHLIEWPPGRVRLLKALSVAQNRGGGRIRVRLPEVPSESEAAEAIEPAHEALVGSEADIDLEAEPATVGQTARLLAFHTADEAGEAREIARRVLALLRQGVPLSEIAVCSNAMKDSARRIQEALRDVGVPSRHGRGQSLAATHVSHLALALAAWGPHEEATREAVCAVVASRAINLRKWAGTDLDSAEIIRSIRGAAIRSRVPDRDGGDGFASRLERYARALESDDNQRGAARVRLVADVLQRFFERLDARPHEATLMQHGRALLELMEELGTSRWLRQVGSDNTSSTRVDLAASESHALEQAAWAALMETLREAEDSERALGLKSRALSRAGFAEWLEQVFSAAILQPGASRGAAVELLELGDVPGRQFSHLFVAGAFDGRLPSPPAYDALFTDDERWVINKLFGRPVLRVPPSNTTRSPFPAASLVDAASLFLSARAASESLTVSRPRSDDRGKPLSDSPLLSLLAPDLPFESVPFQPVDPLLGNRASSSITERRRIAEDRAAFFRGDQSGDAYGGEIPGIAPEVQGLAAGRRELPWSASALEKLSNCGFRYLAEWAWRAKEIQEPEDEPGVMEVGRVAHLAAEVAARAMIQQRIWSPRTANEAVALGLQTATGALDEAEKATVLGHPEAWKITRARMLRRLGLMLEREIERTVEQGVTPFAMELGFGMEGAELPTLEVAGVHIWGQIDRIDVGPSSLIVLDYKSGRTINNAKRFAEDALFESQLQLPLYVAAVDKLLPQAEGKNIDAAYVSLRDTRRSKTLTEAMGGGTRETIKEKLEQAVTKLTSRVRDGHFPIDPRTCIGCHLQPACRIPEKRGV